MPNCFTLVATQVPLGISKKDYLMRSLVLLPCRQGWLPDWVWRGGGCKQGADDPAPQTLRQKLGSGGCVSCVAHLSSSQAFAEVEAISASRSNAELPVIICNRLIVALLHCVRSRFCQRRLLSGWARGRTEKPRCDRGGSSSLRASGGSIPSTRYGGS